MLSRRFLSTSARRNAQFTTLKNGLVVVSESNPIAKSSSVGVYVQAGSRAENPYNSGVSSLTANVLINNLKTSAFESGVKLSASNAREITGLNAEFASGNLSKAFDSLTSALKNSESALNDAALVSSQAKLAGEYAELIEEIPSQTVIEHLHSTAFQGTSLALPIYGKADTVSTLEPMDLTSFYEKTFVASNAAIVGTGDVKHEELVELASKLQVLPASVKPEVAPSSFLGSDVRFRDDTLPKAYVAIAVQGEALSSPLYWTAKVASEVNGEYYRNSLFSKFQGSKLSGIVDQYHLATSYQHFSNSYSDNGLWGFYTESDNILDFDDMVHFTLKEWNRLSISVTETEVERAKAALKLKVLSTLESSVSQANALSTDALILGYKASTAEILAKINKITVSDVKSWASSSLWDKDIAISATGQIEALFDYNRVRNDMSMMRW